MKKEPRKKQRYFLYALFCVLGTGGALWLFVKYCLFPDPLSAAFQELRSGMRQEEVLRVVNVHCPECEFEFAKDALPSRKTYIAFYANWETFNEPTKKTLFGHTIQHSNNSYLSLEFIDGWILAADHAQNRQLFMEYPFDEETARRRDFRGYSGTTHECFGMRCKSEFFNGFNFLTETERVGIQKTREQHQKNKWWICQKTGICF